MRKLLFLLAFVPFIVSCDMLGDILEEINKNNGEDDETEQPDYGGSDKPVENLRQDIRIVEGTKDILPPMTSSFSIVITSDQPLDVHMLFELIHGAESISLEDNPAACFEETPYGYTLTIYPVEGTEEIGMRLGMEKFFVRIAPTPAFTYLEDIYVGVEGRTITEGHTFNLQEQYEWYGWSEVYWSDDENVTCPKVDEDGNYSPLVIGVNPSTSEREITIYAGLRDDEGNVYKVAEYKVYQEGGVMLHIPRTTYISPNTYTKIEIPIESNVEFEVSSSIWWARVLEQSKNRLLIDCEGYHGEASRVAILTLTNAANNFSKTIKIIQFPHAIKTVHLEQAGTLASKYSIDQMLDIVHLQITGKMNKEDFNTLKKFTTLETIDIAGVELENNALPELAFDDMLVENIILPSYLQKIGRLAFAENPVLEGVDIPATVTEIDGSAFYNCPSLKQITLPRGLKMISDGLFNKCISLTEIDIPEGVEEICSGAFRGCTALERVSIPSSLKRFEMGTDNPQYYDYGCQFYDCTSLKEISFPSQVYFIPAYCFTNCTALESVTINSVETIRASAFEGCTALKEAKMSKVTSIHENAFKGCTALETVTFPLISTIYYQAFSGCKALTEVTLPKTLKTIDNYAFSETGLISIEIPKSVTEIGGYAFNQCNSLEEVIIKATILTISKGTFYGCNEISHIELPEKLKTIEDDAFEYVNSVKTLTCLAPVPPTGEGLSDLQWGEISVTVPRESQTTYQEAEWWTRAKEINGLPDDFWE